MSRLKYSSRHNSVSLGSTEFKYINRAKNTKTGSLYFRINHPHCPTVYFGDLREAALFLDKELLKKGLDPINILKKKE